MQCLMCLKGVIMESLLLLMVIVQRLVCLYESLWSVCCFSWNHCAAFAAFDGVIGQRLLLLIVIGQRLLLLIGSLCSVCCF